MVDINGQNQDNQINVDVNLNTSEAESQIKAMGQLSEKVEKNFEGAYTSVDKFANGLRTGSSELNELSKIASNLNKVFEQNAKAQADLASSFKEQIRLSQQLSSIQKESNANYQDGIDALRYRLGIAEDIAEVEKKARRDADANSYSRQRVDNNPIAALVEAKQELAKLNKAKINLEVDDADFNRYLDNIKNRMKEANYSLALKPDVDLKAVRRELKALGETDVDIDANLKSTTGGRWSAGIAEGIQDAISGFVVSFGMSVAASLIGALSSLFDSFVNQIKGALDARTSRETAQTTLNAAAGSDAPELTKAIGGLSDKYGISQTQITKDFSGTIAALKAQGKGVQDIIYFLDAAIAKSKLLGQTTEQAGRSITAYTQMISKNQLYREDLQQLSEAGDPNATQQLAKARGQTVAEFNKSLKNGEVSSDAIYGMFIESNKTAQAALQASLDTTQAKLDRLGKTYEDVQVAFGEKLQPFQDIGIDVLQTALEQLSSGVLIELNSKAEEFASFLKDNPQYMEQLSAAVADLLEYGVQGLVDAIKEFQSYLEKNPDAVQDTVNRVKDVWNLLTTIVSVSNEWYGTLFKVGSVVLGFEGPLKVVWEVLGNILKTTIDWVTSLSNGISKLGQAQAPTSNVQSDAVMRSGEIRTAISAGQYNASRDGGTRDHAGYDFDYSNDSAAQDVYTPAAGKVEQIINDFYQGTKAVVLRMANGDSILIGEFNNTSLKVGDNVPRGAVVGQGTDVSGVSHVEVKKADGTQVNPLEYLTASGDITIADGNVTINGPTANTGIAGAVTNTAQSTVTTASGTNSPSNWDRYLAMLADRESGLNANPAENPAWTHADGGPRGGFQFTADTRQEAINWGVGDPWAGTLNDQAKVTQAYIRRWSPEAAAAIESGNWAEANRLMRRKWSSVDGGDEPQSGRGDSYLTASSTPISIGGSSSSSTVPSSPSSSIDTTGQRTDADKQKAEEDKRQREKEAREKQNRQYLDITEQAALTQAENERRAARRVEDQNTANQRAGIKPGDTLALALFDYSVKQRDIQRKIEDETQSTTAAITAQQKKLRELEQVPAEKGNEKARLDAIDAVKRTIAELTTQRDNLTSGFSIEMDTLAKEFGATLTKLATEMRDAHEKWRAQAQVDSDKRTASIEDAQGNLEVLRSRGNIDVKYQQDLNRQDNSSSQAIDAAGLGVTEAQNAQIKAAETVKRLTDLANADGNLTQEEQNSIGVANEMLVNAKEKTVDAIDKLNDTITQGRIEEEMINEQYRQAKDAQTQAINDTIYANNQQANEYRINNVERTQGVWVANSMRRQAGREAIQYDSEKQIEEAKKAGTWTSELEQSIMMLNDLKLDALNDQFKSLGDTIQDTLVGDLKQFFSTMITGSQSAGEAFLTLISSIAEQLATLALNQIFTDLLGGTSLFGGNKKEFGLSGILGSLGGGKDSSKGGGSFDLGSAFSFGTSLLGAIPGFADGGVVNKATLAMVGEGRHNEAIVPMPNGKAIPVDLRNAGKGNSVNSSISVVVNAATGSVTTAGGADALSSKLRAAVVNIVRDESRPGGALG